MDNRFEPIKYEIVNFKEFGFNYSTHVFVLRDKQTGVMYLANNCSNAGGLLHFLIKMESL